ncbi:MAG: hypothetical protein K0R82_1871, partial [Flavipsychrobacter sp.]|nr:hypothetical protein [Flavipsychrobacter sp.]
MKKLALSLLAFPGILSFANAQQYTPKLARSFPNYLTDTSIGGITGNFEFNGKFYLTDDVRLWTSDGTAGGTQVVKQFFPAGLTTAPAIAALREMGGKLYMVAHD